MNSNHISFCLNFSAGTIIIRQIQQVASIHFTNTQLPEATNNNIASLITKVSITSAIPNPSQQNPNKP